MSSFTTELIEAIYSKLVNDTSLATILGHNPPSTKTIFRRVVPDEPKKAGTDALVFRINSETLPVIRTTRIRDFQLIFTLYCRNHTTLCEASDRLMQLAEENETFFHNSLSVFDFHYDNYSSSAVRDDELKRYVRDIRFRVKAKF